ncbi:MAG: hypothetical protein CBE00_09310 [Planctomycetaceae bacterium TMED240]|nr:hypothetical protein [Rhodopirellula sp.]OUX05819.1 MAG: hypothetical protein CBE00_09310 [Planctomycetaceae bacterium TMED240]
MNNRTGRRLSSRKLAAVALLIIFFIAAILLLRRFDPAEYSFYPKCTLYQATGLHCPGCGATRAVGALAAGRLGDAIRYNPLLILGGPIIAAVIAIKLKRQDQGEASWTVFSVCMIVVVISFAIARNVPSPTRSILAPPSKIVPEEPSAVESKETNNVTPFL